MTAAPENYVTSKVTGLAHEVLEVLDNGTIRISVAAWTAVVDPANYRLSTPEEAAAAAKDAPLRERLRSRFPNIEPHCQRTRP